MRPGSAYGINAYRARPCDPHRPLAVEILPAKFTDEIYLHWLEAVCYVPILF